MVKIFPLAYSMKHMVSVIKGFKILTKWNKNKKEIVLKQLVKI